MEGRCWRHLLASACALLLLQVTSAWVSPTMVYLEKLSGGDLRGLTTLRVTGDGNITTLPAELGELTNLTSLSIMNIPQLVGSIPPQLGKLVRLTTLALTNNSLSGPIPPELGRLQQLMFLKLENNGLDGPIPVELGRLQRLTSLGLNNNGLSGPIPPQLGRLQELEFISLGENKLSGSIPPELGSLEQLLVLSLLNNSLSGAIPPELSGLQSLTFLFLSDNRLSGPIPPELARLPQLNYLVLHDNDLSGPIPPELGRLPLLRSLLLGNNNLSGPIPPELGRLEQLTELFLGGNRLSGPIPPELGSLQQLTALLLMNNSLVGSIPSELGQLQSLTKVSLANNSLSGTIPTGLARLKRLTELVLDGNDLSGPIPPELGKLQSLTFLSVSNNRLSGAIPPELGHLTNLTALRLRNNSFSAPPAGTPFLPATFKDLARLVVLTVTFPDGTVLDLGHVPDSCRLVMVTGKVNIPRALKFWQACRSSGCVLDIRNVEGASLSQDVRKEVCLSKTSVWLSGRADTFLDPEDERGLLVVTNAGTYNTSDPAFIDEVRLGSGGRAYTGVGFSRVGAGGENLCANPGSATATGLICGGFLLFIVVVLGGFLLLKRSGAMQRFAGQKQHGILMGSVLGLVGIASAGFVFLDLYTNVIVIRNVRGAWPQIPLVIFFVFPWVASAVLVVSHHSWASTVLSDVKGITLQYTWPPRHLGFDWSINTDSRWPRLLNLAWLVGLGSLFTPLLLLLDVLGVAERCGVVFETGEGSRRYNFEPYITSRGLIRTVFDAIPNAIFQTVLYNLGSSRATMIYIDRDIFLVSMASSMFSVVLAVGDICWTALLEGVPLKQVIKYRICTCFPTAVHKAEDVNGAEELGYGKGKVAEADVVSLTK